MIDKISLKILGILQEKARIPNVEVARQVGMAPSAVLERIRKLEKTGFIDGYEVRLNPERFGGKLVAFVSVKASEGPDDPDVGAILGEIPEVQEVHFISGDDGYLVKLRTRDQETLGRILREKILPIPSVRSSSTSVVLSTLKETSRIPLSNLDPDTLKR